MHSSLTCLTVPRSDDKCELRYKTEKTKCTCLSQCCNCLESFHFHNVCIMRAQEAIQTAHRKAPTKTRWRLFFVMTHPCQMYDVLPFHQIWMCSGICSAFELSSKIPKLRRTITIFFHNLCVSTAWFTSQLADGSKKYPYYPLLSFSR